MAKNVLATETWQCTEPSSWRVYVMNQSGNFFNISYFNKTKKAKWQWIHCTCKSAKEWIVYTAKATFYESWAGQIKLFLSNTSHSSIHLRGNLVCHIGLLYLHIAYTDACYGRHFYYESSAKLWICHESFGVGILGDAHESCLQETMGWFWHASGSPACLKKSLRWNMQSVFFYSS